MDTARSAFEAVRRELTVAGIPEPEAKARVIVASVLDTALSDVFLPLPLSMAQQVSIDAIAQRCAQGEPVEYVTGKAYFRYLTLAVTPDVLIPRQETEQVTEEAIALIKDGAFESVLDIGTGSGCIAISIATETQARVDACDLSQAALALAADNAAANGAPVRFFLSDMLGSVKGSYDIIVSNPPYISEAEYVELGRGVRDFEPKMALTAGDGLECYRVLAKDAGRYLNAGGVLVLEIGAGQAMDVTALLLASGFDDIIVKKDYSGRDRIVTAHQK